MGGPHKYKPVKFDKRTPHLKKRNPNRYIVDANGCHVWQLSTTANGYPITTRQGKRVMAHKQAYEEVRGAVPDGLVLDHLCKNILCINPEHLEAVTQAENVQRSRLAKLTQQQVLAIRKLRAGGKQPKELAALFSVTPAHIGDIVAGRRW
jgi:hypothetical protein